MRQLKRSTLVKAFVKAAMLQDKMPQFVADYYGNVSEDRIKFYHEGMCWSLAHSGLSVFIEDLAHAIVYWIAESRRVKGAYFWPLNSRYKEVRVMYLLMCAELVQRDLIPEEVYEDSRVLLID